MENPTLEKYILRDWLSRIALLIKLVCGHRFSDKMTNDHISEKNTCTANCQKLMDPQVSSLAEGGKR